jgi:hypothetical protein
MARVMAIKMPYLKIPVGKVEPPQNFIETFHQKTVLYAALDV